MANYPFPNQKLELGSTGRFVTDLQRELNVAVTGVFDFLTMCKVAIHKFENGLNHNEPTVDEETWNSIMNKGGGNNAAAAAAGGGDRADRGNDRPGLGAAGTNNDRPGIAIVGQISRDNDNVGNAAATTNGTTTATDENIPAAARPDTNPDAPREDQPTTTAAEQQAQGGNAGGYEAAPTAEVSNAPTPGAAAAGVESADQPQNPPTATP